MLRRRAPSASAGPGVRCEPRQMRDDAGHLVGWGMGTALFHAPMFQAEARATLRSDGTALVETAGADMGQGAWTALAQIAADGLGTRYRQGRIPLRLFGASRRRRSPAARAIPPRRAAHSTMPAPTPSPSSPSLPPTTRTLRCSAPAMPASRRAAGGFTTAGTRPAAKAMPTFSHGQAWPPSRARGRGARNPANAEARAMFSHGAVFAEAKVDPDLGQIRVTRLVGAFAAGRIINPRLARSQLYGGMIWGLSFALHEEAIHDRRTGRPMNADLAGYHIPVHADIPALEVAADRRGRSLRQRSWGSRESAKSALPAPWAQSPMRSGTRPG